jgi:hypothetical protein
VSAYHHHNNNTIFLFHLPAYSSPPRNYKQNDAWTSGQGTFASSALRITIGRWVQARHSHTASSRPASLPTQQSVLAQCTQTNHKIPIKVIHYLHYRSRRGDGRAVDHQTHTALGALLFRVNYRTVTRLLIHRNLATMVVLHLALTGLLSVDEGDAVHSKAMC